MFYFYSTAFFPDTAPVKASDRGHRHSAGNSFTEYLIIISHDKQGSKKKTDMLTNLIGIRTQCTSRLQLITLLMATLEDLNQPLRGFNDNVTEIHLVRSERKCV